MTDIKTEPVDYCDDLDGFSPDIDDSALLINKNSLPCSSTSIKCEDDQYINYNNVISPKNHQMCEPDPLDVNGVATETVLQDSYYDSAKSEQKKPSKRKCKNWARPKRHNLSILKGGVAAIMAKDRNSEKTPVPDFAPFPSNYSHSELLTQKDFPENLYIGSYPYKCENCWQRTFTVYRKFRNHVLKMHNMDPIKFCDICNLPCGSQKAFKLHKALRHNEDKELCGICNEWISYSIIAQHLKSVHNLNENPSSSSAKYDGEVQEPEKAINDISKKKENNCRCFWLERYSKVRQQNETSTGNNGLKLSNEKCDRCGRMFVKALNKKRGRKPKPKPYDTELNFIKSVNAFTEPDANLPRQRPKSTFICYYLECYLVFQTQEDLDNHRTSHYANISLPRYKCEICSAKYLKLRDLQSHQQHSHLETTDSPPAEKTISRKIVPPSKSKNPISSSISSVSSEVTVKKKTPPKLTRKSKSEDLISSFIDSISAQVTVRKKTPTEVRNAQAERRRRIQSELKKTSLKISKNKVLSKSENNDESSTKMCHICRMEFKTWIGLQCHQKVAKHE